MKLRGISARNGNAIEHNDEIALSVMVISPFAASKVSREAENALERLIKNYKTCKWMITSEFFTLGMGSRTYPKI
ncbi:hypothetical protein [Aeromonas jandaei]|uniref:hypothetical protein n=1 Tax=Aeromonas jandaei TaxID=650 RepID=UPI003BA256C0